MMDCKIWSPFPSHCAIIIVQARFMCVVLRVLGIISLMLLTLYSWSDLTLLFEIPFFSDWWESFAPIFVKLEIYEAHMIFEIAPNNCYYQVHVLLQMLPESLFSEIPFCAHQVSSLLIATYVYKAADLFHSLTLYPSSQNGKSKMFNVSLSISVYYLYITLTFIVKCEFNIRRYECFLV